MTRQAIADARSLAESTCPGSSRSDRLVKSILALCDAVESLERDEGPKPTVDIVFDGPPEHVSGRFVEVESPPGTGANLGRWVHREDGFWALRFDADDLRRLVERVS